MPDYRQVLAEIRTFPQLIAFLRDELDWPIVGEHFEDLTYGYTAEELGIDAEVAAKIQDIKRLRPLEVNQPWGIFFVEFEPRRLPVVALRRVLSSVVVKKRASANSAERAAWQVDDLLFISAYGEGEQRRISFAHFSADRAVGDLPTLRVLGWDGDDTNLHLDYVAEQLRDRLRWPDDTADVEHWRENWSSAFTLRHREVVTTSKQLAVRLADLARAIRLKVNAALAVESGKGPLRTLMAAFKEALIHDLTDDDFADMYAQTIAYGLLSARVSRPAGLVADNIADMVPVTNPFLKELMETFLLIGGRRRSGRASTGIDFDELGVNEVVQLLRDANMEAVLRDFGDRNPQEDPVIHFYELFLKEYDAKKRMQRGVFYTPRPVVSYIVRSVDELLRTEFGLEDGLADTTTWGEMARRNPDLTIPDGTSPKEPFVVVLDPAIGTGTFLVEVIGIIHKTMIEKWRVDGHVALDLPKLWNDYVPKHLLPRLYGYELMMAPYAIAHMKIGLKLTETGYRFGSDESVRVYLTNSLEPAHDFSGQFASMVPALAHEAQAVNAVKRQQRFTVVIGNPPYAGTSSNMTEHAQQLVARYRLVDGVPLGEKKVWLQNDYVKFLGLAHGVLLKSGIGCLGYITDNSYFDGPTFRGLRSNLLSDFTHLYLLNLHGSAKKKNELRGAMGDQNVFDITQAVAVVLSAKCCHRASVSCRTADLVGQRSAKYAWLSKNDVLSVPWERLEPSSPFFLFVSRNRTGEDEYSCFFSIKSAFPLQSVGVQTSRDHLAIDFTRHELMQKVRAFASLRFTDTEVRERYFPGKNVGDYLPGDTRGWSLSAARKKLAKHETWEKEIVPIHYRPFDLRFILNSTLLVDWPRPEVSEQMASRRNLGLCIVRRTENTRDYDYFSVSRNTISNHQVSLKDGTYLLPLYVESPRNTQGLFAKERPRRPNLSPSFLEALREASGLSPRGAESVSQDPNPEEILHYTYAVFHSPGYRSRYAEFLKIDFPRLPLTGNLELFRALARLGGELVPLHLLESPKLDRHITTYAGPAHPEVEKVSHASDTVWLDKAQTRGFRGVPEDVWNFHIGGYQVCEKWLKDRKGRTLSAEDIAHYQKIVVALNETIRIMREIDEVIEKYGGWPGAFASGAEPPKESEANA